MLPYMAAALQMVAATITGDEVANIVDIPRGGRTSRDPIPDTSQLRKWIISLGAIPEVVFDRESDKTILCARMQKPESVQQHHAT